MKTIWFYGKDEKALTTIAEIVGEELITRDKCAEIVVQGEIREILGRGLKDTKEDKTTFADRLGFLGNLLHRNSIFALIISQASLEDRKLVKNTYKNYIQATLDENDGLTDIALSSNDPPDIRTKKVVDFLISQKLIPEQAQEVYSKEEEEEIRRRLEELGYV